MSTPKSIEELWIEKLNAHLKAEGYSRWVQRCYPAYARHLLEYCDGKGLTIESIRTAHLTRFLRQQYQRFCKRHRAQPAFQKWRRRYTGAIYILLRLVHGRWPVPDPPVTALEVFHRELIDDYDTWLRDLRGLHAETRIKRTTQALRFLGFLGPRANRKGLAQLNAHDIDRYLKHCCRGLRRASIEDCTVCLRAFLRHLYRHGCTSSDLGDAVIGPRIYEHEGIPSALGTEDVRRVLEVTRPDQSVSGLRDYAILMLLVTYGLRATEVIRLRLDDIDWRRDILRVRHSKTGTYSELPLLPKPGEALLRYLENARPQSTLYRDVFLRLVAPHRPYKDAAILNCITSGRLRAAGVTPQGKKGPHAFRHARAVSLLRSGVSLKVIGDVLGHTTPQATGEYLKLATEDLRAIGLDLPREVSP
jgi:integrase/recombinase XerD